MEFYTNVSRYGNSILYRGYRDGTRISQKVPFKPTMFVPNEQGDWKTLKGRPMAPMTFDSMKDATDFMKKYEGVGNFEVAGNTNFVAQFIDQNFPKNIEFDRDRINVCTIDIEVASDEGFPHPDKAEYPIITITVKNNIDNVYYVWGLYDYDVERSIMKTNKVVYEWCESEAHLITSFLKWWSDPFNMPDIVTGWNSKLFDMTYIVNRIGNTIGADQAKKLSPWGRINQRNVFTMNKEQQAYEIVGVQQLDFMELFKKFGYKYGPQASYKLDAIANVVLGEKKLSYEEHGNLFTLYKEDFQKFVDYNIRDVELVDRMEDKTGLISLALTMAYKAGVNYDATFGTTGIWDTFIYRVLTTRKIAVPPNESDIKTDFGGGYVKDPIVGRHNWVVSFDLNSLYPHIIMQYNMSPETVVNDRIIGVSPDTILQGATNSKPELAMAATGQLFKKDAKGIIPDIIDGLYSERKTIKRSMLDAEQELVNLPKGSDTYALDKKIATAENQQMAIKILMNSLYGAMGNIHFRYYDIRIAEGITASGRTAIRWAEKAVNDYMNKILKTNDDYVIAIDTDSVYISMDKLVKTVGLTDTDKTVKFLDTVAREKFEPLIADAYQDLANRTSAYENKMVMAREVIADRGIWTAKKRYILNVHNSEGVQYPEPKLKMMGIEAIKSSTPEICKAKFKEVFKILINGTEGEMRKFVNDFRKEFKTLPPEEIAAPRGVSNVGKYVDRKNIYVKGTPLHVRGSLVYNNVIKMNGLDNRYLPISDGERIKYLYLKMPNPIKENVVSFPEELPKALNLHPYIDYDTQFEKVFEDALTIILDAIDWKVKEEATLEDFFS